jgi:CDP-glucose 4,6-dehydratase
MSFWKEKNVLITGINGFVASNIAKSLVSKGANVVGMLKDVTTFDALKELAIDDKVTVTFGDILDAHAVRRTVNKYEVDVCFHLAAMSTVRICSRDPVVAFRTNVEGTWNVLDACKNSQTIKAVVVASTDKCYGVPERLPYKEGDPLNGLATYDATKACTDIVARSFAFNYGMPISVTRCCNIYGPGDLNLSRIIPNTIRRVVAGKPAMLWDDSAAMVREFIYIDDVVDGYIKLAEHIDLTKGKAYNIGTMEHIKVEEFVKKIFKCMGKEPDIEINERESTFKEIPDQYLDSSLMTETTGWEPKHDLDSGLQKTVDWYVKFFKSLEENK